MSASLHTLIRVSDMQSHIQAILIILIIITVSNRKEMISQNKEEPCWEGFQEHQIAWCHVSYHMAVFVQRTSGFLFFDGANWWTEGWVPLPEKRDNFSLKSALELRDQVSGGQQEPTEDQWGLVAQGSKPHKSVPMASLRSLSTEGNTNSSDEAKERGNSDNIPLR